MKNKLKFMRDNDVWDLVELPKGKKSIGCKWVFKIKQDSNDNVKSYKARLFHKEIHSKRGY